jgi:uncharacterized protein (TIGR03067 family)
MLSATLGRAEDAPSAPTDEALIRGSWQLMSKTEQGVEAQVAESADDQLELTFEERTFRAKLGPKAAPIEVSGDYTLDSQQTPKLLDVTIQGNGNSTAIQAIYKLEKEQLHVRIPGAGGQRPVDFDTPAPDCVTLVLRRAPK